MQTRFLCALIAMAVAGHAAAQTTQLPAAPAARRPPPVPFVAGLPPLPPGCAVNATLPPPLPPPPMVANEDGLAKNLGINSAQAAKVQQIFEHQAEQAQRLDRQRRETDAETCRNLRSIVGDQGMTRWSAAMPPPPPRGPGHRPSEMSPPPPQPGD